MNDIKKTYYLTTDYAQFKRLKGNRDVLDARRSKLIKSIETMPKSHDSVIVSTDYGERYEVKASFPEFKALVGANWISKSSRRNTNEN